MAVTIKHEGEVISVSSPYSGAWTTKAKKLGGKWSRDRSAWVFNSAFQPEVEAGLQEVYGTTGDNSPTCTVKVTAKKDIAVVRGPIELRGRIIVQAWGRDSGVKPGADVSYVSGKATSGGSANYWETKVLEGATFKVAGFPLAAVADVKDGELWDIEIEPDVNIQALQQERARLAARIQEIDDILLKHGE